MVFGEEACSPLDLAAFFLSFPPSNGRFPPRRIWAETFHFGRMSLQTKMPIGVFDSGIGGLTVARQIHRLLPHEDLVYLGDTARVPYGTKSPSAVVRFASEDTRFLLEKGVKAVVVACNTVSAWALPALRLQFEVPIFGVVIPGVTAALEARGNGRIGIVGTSATIRSDAYRREILERSPEAKVFSHACPLLVPLVEEGWENHRITRMILAEYLRPLLRRRVGVLVLGCTHYPLLKRAIRKIVPSRMVLVDSAESCANGLRVELEARRLACGKRNRMGKTQLFLTDEVSRFEELAKRFLGVSAGPVQRVDLKL